MDDSRLTPSNGRFAAAELEGSVKAEIFVEGEWLRCADPVVSLHVAPSGALACQLLFGEGFRVLDCLDGWAFGQSGRDGYVGYVRQEALANGRSPTHWVSSLASHVYPAANVKSIPEMSLHLGALLALKGRSEREFIPVAGGGYVPAAHVSRLQTRPSDFVAVAKRFLGCPYLWGGNTASGIDCSGLVQVALSATGKDCPRDSDMQEETLGTPLDSGHAAIRGDLAFWKGHVGIMLGEDFMLHATARHMAVVAERFSTVRNRIAALGGHPFHGFRRV